MQWIPPDTIRVHLPKNTPIRRDSKREVLLLEDVTVDVRVDEGALLALARQACKNRTHRSVDGALKAQPLGEVRFGVFERQL